MCPFAPTYRCLFAPIESSIFCLLTNLAHRINLLFKYGRWSHSARVITQREGCFLESWLITSYKQISIQYVTTWKFVRTSNAFEADDKRLQRFCSTQYQHRSILYSAYWDCSAANIVHQNMTSFLAKCPLAPMFVCPTLLYAFLNFLMHVTLSTYHTVLDLIIIIISDKE
jgi:hypothetical protein